MDNFGWQEIAVRLLFAFILGSATAISQKWYLTKQYIQSNTLMAIGAAMFSILASLTLENNRFPFQLIIGISIVCVGVGFQTKTETSSINIDTVTKLWCASAAGTMVGFGFFVPAYLGILTVILANLLFDTSETNFITNIKKELNSNTKSESELEPIPESTPAREIHYQCLVSCLVADEAEVLASLVELGKDKDLIPTKISSKNIADNNIKPKTEIKIDFVSKGNSSPLQLQQVLMSLKSRLEVYSASWLNLSSEIDNNNIFVMEKPNKN